MQKFVVLILLVTLGAVVSSCGKEDSKSKSSSSSFFPTVNP